MFVSGGKRLKRCVLVHSADNSITMLVNIMLSDRAVIEQAEGAALMYSGTVPCWQSASRYSVRSTLHCQRSLG